MAALLRSARLLRFSPSGSLQIVGTKRNGPPLSRLYGGVVGGRTTGPSIRQVACSVGTVPRHTWPCASSSGSVRGYALSTEQREDEASMGVRSRQAQQFDWALARLDNSVRRTGRITKTQLLSIFHDICRTGYPSGNQALLLLRSCGSLMPEIPFAERTELAHRIWDELQKQGASYDSSHYNALLKVYLQNEFKFSPTDFLAKMEAANVAPNRVTYQRLIAAYCQNGDIEGASTILGFMKSKDLAITEAVFNALLTGHAKAGDMESAANILPVMRGAGIEPGPDTYVALLTAYAEKGDMENIKKTLETVEAADTSLMDRDLMQVIFSLAMAGQQQHIPELVDRMKHDRGYVPDSMNLCLSLITQGHEDTAFTILKTLPSTMQEYSTSDGSNLGNFFLRHLVSMEKPVEKIVGFCKELQDANLHASPLLFTLACALEHKNTGLSYELMKAVKEQDLPLRPHYFWPLLTEHVNKRNTEGVLEVVKGMQELGVAVDEETFFKYILHVFPDREAACKALEEVGCSLMLGDLLPSEIRKYAQNDLAALYTMLAEPSFPPTVFRLFEKSLIAGFKKTDNVEDMVKISELLYKDARFSRGTSTPAFDFSNFLYRLINSMSKEEVLEQETKLREYIHKLKLQGVIIPFSFYRGISNILSSMEAENLIRDVLSLVGDDTPKTRPSPTPRKEESKRSLKDNLLSLLRDDNINPKLPPALVLKEELKQELDPGAYAYLLDICCQDGNVEEALKMKTEMGQLYPDEVLDQKKYTSLIKVLVNHGRMDEAVEFMKEMKQKGVEQLRSANITQVSFVLSDLAKKGDIEGVRRLQDTMFTLELTKPYSKLCSPLINAYLENNDPAGAVDAAMDFFKRFKLMPRIHDIVVDLVEKGDTELLQKFMDFENQERGEMAMMYDLFFAFLQTARYREARKIIETPGLRAKRARLDWYATKCIATKKMEPLENMVELTAKLFECDRDDMYFYLLRLCKETNDFRKAEATWTKMQEENVIPRERTLHLLADILKSNGQEVPFEVPETWHEDVSIAEASPTPATGSAPAGPTPDAPAATASDATASDGPAPATPLPAADKRMLILCKKNKAKEAYDLLKDADQQGTVDICVATYDTLIRSLLAGGHLEEAMHVKDMAVSRFPFFQLKDLANSLLVVTHCHKEQPKEGLAILRSMLQADQVPTRMAVVRLVEALARGPEADPAAVQEVATMLKDVDSALAVGNGLFPNNTALAYIRRGDVESAVDLLEAVYTAPDSTRPGMNFVFKKVLVENHDKALDKLSAMAERLANHFACYRPITDLFLALIDSGKVEDAKFLLARCNAVAEQKRFLMGFLTDASKRPGQAGNVKTLLSLIPDFTNDPNVYPYVMKCYARDNDLESAVALREQMLKEGLEMDELSLKRLADLYRRAGLTAPFTEPPMSFQFYALKLKKETDTAAPEE